MFPKKLGFIMSSLAAVGHQMLCRTLLKHSTMYVIQKWEFWKIFGTELLELQRELPWELVLQWILRSFMVTDRS